MFFHHKYFILHIALHAFVQGNMSKKLVLLQSHTYTYLLCTELKIAADMIKHFPLCILF